MGLTYQLVTSEEADVTKGLISTTSPIGRALLGKKSATSPAVITPNGANPNSSCSRGAHNHDTEPARQGNQQMA